MIGINFYGFLIKITEMQPCEKWCWNKDYTTLANIDQKIIHLPKYTVKWADVIVAASLAYGTKIVCTLLLNIIQSYFFMALTLKRELDTKSVLILPVAAPLYHGSITSNHAPGFGLSRS